MSAAPVFTAPAAESEVSSTGSRWRLAKLLAFRFVFAYLVIFQLPLPIGALPWTEGLDQKYESIWHIIVPWAGAHILHVSSPVSTANTGSGDRMYDWILVLCYVTFAAVATLIWSAIDRNRSDYRKLDMWLRLYVRFSLATWMMSYGGAKVIPSQFPLPRLNRLIQPYGESSPMGLLWTFMGASPGYTIITGAVELLAGALLVLPRTAMLGAIVSAAAITQVFILNMCYDVPVKLFSFHLILMSLFLLLPNARRFAVVFLSNRAVGPASTQPLFERRNLNRAALVVQGVFGLYLLGWSVHQGYEVYKEYGAGAPKPPLYGIWSVDEVSIDGVLQPPLLTDETRWRRAIFQRAGFLVIQPMTGANQVYALELDIESRTIALTNPENPGWKAEFSFEEPEPSHLSLTGQVGGKSTRARLVRVDESQFLLTSRGFHWISEVPFNR